MSDTLFDMDASVGFGAEIDGAGEVRDALAGRIDDVLARTNGAERVVRVSVPVPGELHPLDWLRAQRVTEAVYWSGGTGEARRVPSGGPPYAATTAGIGAADRIEVADLPVDYAALERRLTERLRTAEAPVRYFGGLRFDASQSAQHRSGAERPDRYWQPFGAARFVLPRFSLLSGRPESGGDGAQESDTRLACTLVLPRDTARAGALTDAAQHLALPRSPGTPSDDALPALLDRTDAPTKEEWTQMVTWALDAFQDGRLDKVVLARRVALTFGDDLDPLHVLRHLEGGTPGCFHFAVRPGASADTFIGASPERLFRRRGGRVSSEAVAGTRSRGDSAQADAALRDELLESEKDRREHAFVEAAVRDRLGALCTEVDVDEEASELELARGRHLHSQVRGTLRPDVSAVDLLAALHPTPAVGGVPHADALTAIREQEPFDRGWYAGPVGWIGREDAEFAVAIRSGLVRGDEVDLFSGAGIVTGSDPSSEWDEIEQKIADLAAALGM